MRNTKMNKELLTILVPKTASLEKSSHAHDSITPEDVNTILSYSNLNKQEYNFLLMKFINETSSENMFYRSILSYYRNRYKEIDYDFLNKMVNLSIIECCNPVCPICHGTGVLKTMNSISVCPHCTEGIFNFTEDVRMTLLQVDKKQYAICKKRYERMVEHIRNIETSALSKIGDVDVYFEKLNF